MGYDEPFGANACVFVCLFGFLCPFPCSPKYTTRTFPAAQTGLPLTNAERKTELPEYSQIYRTTKYVYLPASLIYQLSPS